LLILLADNYNRTTNGPPQRHRGCTENFFSRAIRCKASAQRFLRSWPPLLGRAVRASLSCRPGGLACLASARARGRRQVGPEGLVCLPPVGEFSWRWILGNDRSFLLLLAKNYNLAATDRTTEAQRHRDSFGAIPSVLQPCGPQAAAPGQPQGRDCCQRSCPGRCSWPPPMGRAVRAWQTGGT
jgi:hypothetical protein